MFDSDQSPLDPNSPNPFWLFGSVTDRLVTILSMTPSGQTWTALTMIGRAELSSAERVLCAEAWDRQVNSATAQLHAAVVSATTPTTGSEHVDLGVEVGLALRRSAQGADGLVAFANRVVNVFPTLFTLMEAGNVGIAYARVLDDVTFDLDDEQARTIDAQISDRAASLTLPAFRRAARRAVAAFDPDASRRRHERAKRTETGVRLSPRPDGMAAVTMTMPADQAITTVGEINARADRLHTPDDERTHGQRQVHAVQEALAGAEPVGDGPVRFRRNGQIIAFIDLPTLIGLRDGVGELTGHGPVPAAMIRDILTQPGSTLHRLVHDPVAHTIVDYSIDSYGVDEFLRQILEVRDVTCRFPGCTRNAAFCDSEHCQPYDDGGPTSCANCGLMCRRHHNHKTHGGLRYRRPDPATGETEWTTPLGFTYRQQPASYAPDGRDTGDTRQVGRPPPNIDPPF